MFQHKKSDASVPVIHYAAGRLLLREIILQILQIHNKASQHTHASAAVSLTVCSCVCVSMNNRPNLALSIKVFTARIDPQSSYLWFTSTNKDLCLRTQGTTPASLLKSNCRKSSGRGTSSLLNDLIDRPGNQLRPVQASATLILEKGTFYRVKWIPPSKPLPVVCVGDQK